MEENGNDKNQHEVLTEFRSQWQREIEESQRGETSISSENLAKNLFLEGIQMEKKGLVFDAIRKYRRAIHLDPNIEHKIYQASIQHSKQLIKEDVSNNNNNTSSTSESIAKDLHVGDLIERFQRELSMGNMAICESVFAPGTIRTGLHISQLPVEVLLLILKYVVSSNLDMKSLERFGSVCRGFFLLSRDSEIWKLACQNVWKVNLSPPSLNSTWRDIFLNRCRVLYDGCYISKISYQRHGENSFQDQFYAPLMIVQYFRLIRFFPNGELMMMTSADELQTSVNRLKNIKNAFQSRDILKGRYHYQDNHVLIVIKRYSSMQKFKRKNVEDESPLTFFLELEIANTSKRKFSKLVWKNYSISQVRNEQELSSDYDLRSATKYPPFYFSHVKSFHMESTDYLK